MPIFKGKQKDVHVEGEGLVLFETVQDAMKGEKIVKDGGYSVKMVAPPPELRKGCDLALQINLVEQAGIDRLLRQKEAAFVEIVPVKKGTSALLDIVKVTDFGDWIMVKAGNMKLTYDKKTCIIVNTSGGGCPDIPYLHGEMLDRKMTDVARPRESGFTLCAWMLDRALVEGLERTKEEAKK
jgi:hypothetical protein